MPRRSAGPKRPVEGKESPLSDPIWDWLEDINIAEKLEGPPEPPPEKEVSYDAKPPKEPRKGEERSKKLGRMRRQAGSRERAKSEREIHGSKCNCKACRALRDSYAKTERGKRRWRLSFGLIIGLLILAAIVGFVGANNFGMLDRFLDDGSSIPPPFEPTPTLSVNSAPTATSTPFTPFATPTTAPNPTAQPSPMPTRGSTPLPTPTLPLTAPTPRTIIATRTPVPRPTLPPAAMPPPTVIATPFPIPTSTPAPFFTSTPEPMPEPTPEPKPEIPHLRHLDEKQYMLELINAERTGAGLDPVVLGDNDAAQMHAESALENCFSSHWGMDGLKPYMRYSLAGGYQSNGENVRGSDYCITASDGYRPLGGITEEIEEAIVGWMGSPGHRRNLLNPWHKKVNIGLAWNTYNIAAVQHFEGEYVEYEQLPQIANGTLAFRGHTLNELEFSDKEEMGLQLYFDPPPHALTRGQVSRTYCYDSGFKVAAFRYPLTGRSYWSEDEFTTTHSRCSDPYDISPESPGPRSASEAHQFWFEAYSASQIRIPQRITGPWITASEWTARGDEFAVVVDISDLLAKHGPGVYTMLLWGEIDGEDVPVSEHSMFYQVDPPDTYDAVYEQ